MPRCLYCLSLFVTHCEGRDAQSCECGLMVCEDDQRVGYFDDDTLAISRRNQRAIDDAIAECEE